MTLSRTFDHRKLPRNSRLNRPVLYGKCGVYAVINEELGQICYIGSTTNIYARYVAFLGKLRKRLFAGTKIQEAFDRYGEKAVSLEILEETMPENRLEQERLWIKLYVPEANSMHTFRDKERMEKRIPQIREATKRQWENPAYRETMIRATHQRWQNWRENRNV